MTADRSSAVSPRNSIFDANSFADAKTETMCRIVEIDWAYKCEQVNQGEMNNLVRLAVAMLLGGPTGRADATLTDEFHQAEYRGSDLATSAGCSFWQTIPTPVGFCMRSPLERGLTIR